MVLESQNKVKLYLRAILHALQLFFNVYVNYDAKLTEQLHGGGTSLDPTLNIRNNYFGIENYKSSGRKQTTLKPLRTDKKKKM